MALAFLFDPNKQFQSLGGVNEVGGFLRVFLNGTDDRATTYKNFDGTLNEADIELDANGRAVVIVDNTKTYRLEVYNRLGGLMWTVSNFTAQGGSGGGGTPVSVEGTEGELDVDSYSSGGILHFVVGLSQTIKDTLTSLSLSVTSLMASIGLCELVSNKKDTLTGYEASTTDYPSIKAVVDFVNSAMQNMGGKLITDNGDPFTDSSDLPSTTPYGGVDIDDKDYAYIQNAGSAERWSATVSGSSVAWVQEYAISIPVFTPAQQAAIDSGITSTILGNLLTKTGDGSNVTAAFMASGTRTNISTGEKLSVIFGKIAKWFGDLKAVAFSGSYNDLSDKPTIPTVNNGTLTIYRNGVSQGTFSANQSGLTGIDISVPTKTSQLVNDSFASVATSGSYNDLSNKPTIPTVNNGTLTIKQNNSVVGTFTANQSNNVDINLTNTTYGSLTPSPASDSVSLCTRGEKFTWGTTGSQLQCARATKTGRYIDIGRLHERDYGADVEGVAHFTIVGKLSTWANENNALQFRADVCVEFRHKPNSYPFETSRIYGRILYKGNSSQLSGMSVVTRTEYHIDVATHYDLVIALSIPNASNNYTRIAVESFYAMNNNVGDVDGIKMSYDRDITIYDTVPSGPHIDQNQSYELPTI